MPSLELVVIQRIREMIKLDRRSSFFAVWQDALDYESELDGSTEFESRFYMILRPRGDTCQNDKKDIFEWKMVARLKPRFEISAHFRLSWFFIHFACHVDGDIDVVNYIRVNGMGIDLATFLMKHKFDCQKNCKGWWNLEPWWKGLFVLTIFVLTVVRQNLVVVFFLT